MRRLLTGLLLTAALWPVQALGAGNGKTSAVNPAAGNHPLKELWSGYHYSSSEIRNLQDSDGEAKEAGRLWGAGRRSEGK